MVLNEGEILCSVAISFICMGVALMWLSKSKHIKWCIKIRKQLVKEYESKGNWLKAQKNIHEIYILRVRLPKYSKIILATGAVLFIVAYVLREK